MKTKSEKKGYKWDEWFACEVFVLKRGVDYTCGQSTIVQTIRNMASARGLLVSVVDQDVQVTVQVRQRDPEKKEKAR